MQEAGVCARIETLRFSTWLLLIKFSIDSSILVDECAIKSVGIEFIDVQISKSPAWFLPSSSQLTTFYMTEFFLSSDLLDIQVREPPKLPDCFIDWKFWKTDFYLLPVLDKSGNFSWNSEWSELRWSAFSILFYILAPFFQNHRLHLTYKDLNLQFSRYKSLANIKTFLFMVSESR